MPKHRFLLAVILALAALAIALPASMFAASQTSNGITLTYPDGPNCVVGQDVVSVTSSPDPAGGVLFNFFGTTGEGSDLVALGTVTVPAAPFEAIVPYNTLYPIVAVFAALLDADGNPIQDQKISAKWTCIFADPTATPTPVTPSPTPTNTPTNTPTPKTPEPSTPTPTLTPTPITGGQGCTPGYWRQSHHFDSWPSIYVPSDYYNQVFGVNSSFGATFTLLSAVQRGGAGENALARHAVAALLNAAHENVTYAYTVDEVISMVQQAYATGGFEATKNLFEAANEAGCSLN